MPDSFLLEGGGGLQLHSPYPLWKSMAPLLHECANNHESKLVVARHTIIGAPG